MKKTRIFLLGILVIILSFSLKVSSQNLVGVGGISAGCNFSYNENLFSSKSSIIRIYPHIITKEDGSGGEDEAFIDLALEKARQQYAEQNIFLYFCRPYHLIKNTKLYNDIYSTNSATLNGIDYCKDIKELYEYRGDEDEDPQVVASDYCDGLNIFIWPRTQSGNTGAFAIVSKSVIIGSTTGYDAFNNPLSLLEHWLSHEIGHCLGLFHTHHGTGGSAPKSGEDQLSSCVFTPEKFVCSEATVVGSNLTNINSQTCGDYVGDTPPDPSLAGSVDTECNLLPTAVIAPYQPLLKNIMSYSHALCLESFTNGQGNRIRYYIENCDYTSSIKMRGYSECKMSTQLPLDKLPTNNDYCFGISYSPNTIYLAGKIEIDQNFVLSAQNSTTILNIIPLKDTEIIVKSGNTLTIDRCNIQTCSDMWKGIIVENGATLKIINSYCADAVYAVQPNNGSTVHLENSIFDRNIISLFVSPSVNGIVQNIDITLINNTFECSGSLKDGSSGALIQPYLGKSYAGICVSDLAILSLSGQFRFDYWEQNKFKNLHNGIIAHNTNVYSLFSYFENISRARFANCQSGFGIFENNGSLYCEGMGKNSGTTFLNCTNAIWANNTYIEVSKNAMFSVNNGVHIQNNQKKPAYIYENSMYVSDYGIKALQNYFDERSHFSKNDINLSGGIAAELANPLFTAIYADHCSQIPNFSIYNNIINVNGGQGGIYIANCRKNLVIDNQIYLNEALNEHFGIKAEGNSALITDCNYIKDKSNSDSKNIYRTIGISASNCFNSDWTCNTFRKTDIGLNYIGLCDNATVKANDLDNNTTGLLLGMLPNIGIGIIGLQPGSSIDPDRGNIWSNNGKYKNNAAWHLGAKTQAVLSRFLVDSQEDNRFLPSSIIPANGWFIDVANPDLSEKCSQASIASASVCNTFNTGTKISNNPLYQAIAKGSFNTTIYKDASKRIGEFHLWEQLQDDNKNLSEDLQIFYDTNLSGQLDRLYWINKDIENLNSVRESENGKQQKYFILLTQNLHLLDSINNLLNDNKWNANQLLDFRNTKKELLKKIYELNKSYETLVAEITKQRNGNIANTAIFINSLEGHSIFDQYLIDVNKAQVYLLQHDSLDNEMYDLVHSIALSCPFEGGASVYKARAILTYLNGYAINYNDADICTINTEILSRKIKNNFSFKVFPNPTNDEVKIAYDAQNEEISISIVDVLGKVVYSNIFSKIEDLYRISTNTFPNGVYFIKILDANSSPLTTTINIIH